jgi:glycosyltransferase involved in cell wall biosynthesis
MIAGLPVLGVNVSGINEVLENGACGYLVERNEDAIVKGILTLSGDKAYRASLCEKSLKKSQEFLDSHTVYEYEQLITMR